MVFRPNFNFNLNVFVYLIILSVIQIVVLIIGKKRTLENSTNLVPPIG